MQVTLIKHKDHIEVIANQDELPLDIPVVLYSSDAIAKQMGYRPEELLQLDSILSEEEEDWSIELNALVKS